ncbi:MAG: hypothetical protein JKY95_01455 [Planctomycetaceae bacterium]|nr:hypothetical protein [Planctomycetaceae bacterium]
MRTIKISILKFSSYSPLNSLGSLRLCALLTAGLLGGCSPSDEGVYHEMTSQELIEFQKQDTPAEAPSETPPEEKTATVSPVQPADPAALDKNMQENNVTQLPTGKPSAKPTDSTLKKSDVDNPKESGKKSESIAMVSKKDIGSSPLTAAQIKSRSGMTRPGFLLPGDKPLPIEKLIPKLLIPEKTFRKEGTGDAVRVSFDDIDLMKVLNMEPVPEDAPKMFPAWLSGLEGKRVQIRGFMFPTLSQSGITYFQHVRDNEICCFGRTPKVYDRISTILREGVTTSYIQGRPFDVEGTLRIDPIYIDDEWLQLYVLEDAIVLDGK